MADSNSYAHHMVMAVALGIADALYEECAKNNEWYKHNKSRRNFVKKTAPEFFAQAREILVDMLATNITESEKQDIYDALLADASIPRAPKRSPFIIH